MCYLSESKHYRWCGSSLWQPADAQDQVTWSTSYSRSSETLSYLSTTTSLWLCAKTSKSVLIQYTVWRPIYHAPNCYFTVAKNVVCICYALNYGTKFPPNKKKEEEEKNHNPGFTRIRPGVGLDIEVAFTNVP